MTMELTFRQLFEQMKRLKEMLDPLRCLLPDDPHNMEVALVQHLRESVETAGGWLDDCLDQSQAAQENLGRSDLNRSRKALTRCQTSFDEVERTFWAELLSYDKMREIEGLGARRRGIWLIWSHNVKNDLDVCRYELDRTRKALTACWQELAEYAGTTSLSVQTSLVGQQIRATRPEVEEMEAQGVT